MELVSLGVDLCSIPRMERALARHPTMSRRVFTDEEVAYCDSRARPAESYAGRFAAREAVIKALGGYWGKRWKDISVARHPSGAPSILLAGNAARRAESLGIERFMVSFTHDHEVAVAFCVGVRG
jgi:holo-[acyl-carrier protein] synthase